MKSLKWFSIATNVLVFLASFIVFIGVDGLNGVIPDQYKYIAPLIVTFAGFLLTTLTESARVERAEELVKQGSGVNARNESKKL